MADNRPAGLIPPMLATPGDAPAGPAWAYEFKWDGVRAVTYLTPTTVTVVTRNDRDVTATYPELQQLPGLLGGRQAVLDGEIVALDQAGVPSFAQLQRRMHVTRPTASLIAAVPVRYHVFDLLELDGAATLSLPYRARRELLTSLDLHGEAVDTPANFTRVDVAEVTAAAARRGLEGILAKRLTSPYRPGRRSPDWIKTPFSHTQEVIIVGYKSGEGRRAGTIGSLVLAVTEPDGSLSYAGGVGTGFTHQALTHLQRQMAPWARRTPTLAGLPREHTRGVRWVDPVLVGEVAYRTWTPDGRLRHPSWRGLRPDRAPGEARRPTTRPGQSADAVEDTMHTRDGRWHVDVMRRNDARWYRIRHRDNQLDGLDLPGVEGILADAGIDLADLIPASPPIPPRDATA